MATPGNTTTDALNDSLDRVVAAARIVREYEGCMPGLSDKVTLGVGTGLSWIEIALEKLSAQAVTETTVLDNAQQMQDTPLTITPTIAGVQTFVTDRVAQRISKNAFAQTGTLAQNAIQRKKDEDGLVVLDGATTSLCGAGNTLSSGHISAGVVQTTSNTTEGASPSSKMYCVLHGFQIKDIYDEVTAGIGTYVIPEGETARVFSDGFKGSVAGAMVFEDGNISIDGNADAKGGVFSGGKGGAIILVQGRTLRTETRREPHIGGGGTSLWLYDEYAFGERSPGHWLYELYSDATAPTA